ncbi:hypothetical protein Tco_1367880 [Tanacetum coccineum]
MLNYDEKFGGILNQTISPTTSGTALKPTLKPNRHDEKLVPTKDRQFDLDNKTCQIDVELFQEILDISLRVPNQEFTVPPSNDSLFDFLLELGYKGQLKHISEMFVDHMHQPWRTLRAIINRCLSGKTSSNDRLRPSRIEILWGIYHKENVGYATLIWEDLQYQVDNRQSKVRRREIMPYPKFTKVIIHHFMSQHKSVSKRQGSPYHTVDKDGVLDRLKFISKGEIHQVYGKSIPDTLITDNIQNSEAYKTFIGLSTCLIPPKIGRGKGTQGSKATVTPKKATAVSKKKKAKKIESSDEESEEQEESEGAGITPEVPDELTGKFIVSDEGVGTSPEVPDETKDKSEAQDDLDDWSSIDDETFLFDVKEENPEDILWVSIDEDESDDDDEEDDESIDTESTDDEKSDTNVEDQVKGVAKINIDEEAEEEKAEKVEEQKADEELKADEEE